MGKGLVISFNEEIGATIVTGLNLLPISFWIIKTGLVFLISPPTVGSRFAK